MHLSFSTKSILLIDIPKLYKKFRLDIRYPANVKRLEIFISLLKKHKPKKIIDAGCGAGMPLIQIKKKDIIFLDMIKRKTWLKKLGEI